MYTEHQINSSKNFISGWYIDKELCQEIINETEKRKFHLIGDTSGVRNYLVISCNLLGKKVSDQYEKIISDLLVLYAEQYPVLKKITLQFTTEHDTTKKIPDIQIQKYRPGNFYRALHYERDDDYKDRELAFMTYLNDINDGGGTDFPYQNFKSSAQQGLTLIWPAGFTHPHVGIVSPTETKYIVTGWAKITKSRHPLFRNVIDK